MGVEVEVTAKSHVGLVRERNEDYALLGEDLPDSVDVLSEVVTKRFEVSEPTIVAAVDGLGGHPGGDVAAKATAEYLFSRRRDAVDQAAVDRLVRDASEEIFRLMDLPENEALRGMGATVAGLALVGPGAVWFNVGDARAYVFVDGRLSQLSTDDSPLGPTGGSRTSRVLQTVGGGWSPTPIDPHVGSLSIHPGDRLLLCTDGLTDLVDHDAIASMLGGEASEVVPALVQAALDAGGRDNATVVLVDRHP